MNGHASASTRHVSAAGMANTATPVTSDTTAALACLSFAPATRAFTPRAARRSQDHATRRDARSRAPPSSGEFRRRRPTNPSSPSSDIREPRGGHVPAGDRHAHAQAVRLDLAREQRGERRRAARLGDRLPRSNSSCMAATISVVGTVTTSSTSFWMTGNVSSPGAGHLLAVGDRARYLDAIRCYQRAHEVVAGLRLDADDAACRASAAVAVAQPRAARRRRGRRAARPGARRPRSAPAHGALAGHHVHVVVRVDRVEPPLVRPAPPAPSRVPAVAVEQDDFGAVAARGG